MILGIQDTRLRANTKISVTGHKKSEVISSLFHTFALSHPSSLMVLAWKLSSLRHLHLERESKLPTQGFYILKASPIRKEKIEDLRDRGCSLNDPPQITCTVLDQPFWQGHRVLCLALHGLVALTQHTHDCQFPPELHDWSLGEAALKITPGGWSRPRKSLWWPINSTTSSFRGIIRGNEIDYLHPILYVLITGLLLRGVWVRYFMESWFPFVPHPFTSSLPHMPALSFPVLLGKWWSQWIPEPTPLPGPIMSLPWPPCCWGECNACVERHRVHKALSLSELLHGWGYKLFGAAMVRHFCSGSIHSFHLEALSRCLSWDSMNQRLISFQINWFDLVVYGTLKNLLKHHSSKAQFFGIHHFLWSR